MFPATPPATDLSRTRLRQLASWIRDELDPVIAQEGPDTLRADDVLILHDVFQALRTSTTTTALDLRATGIHRALIEVSGIATRWPGRLADDCDKVITVWTAKFGRLDDLHPFLYGRGGRLEGIAHVDDFSKAALLKRWQHVCPERISSKRSHKVGSLGFKAGAWWINPLFAWHAGIIDLESTEGGICFDKSAAYALLLKDEGEIEAASPMSITYRCSPNDKGRYRLTAATPRSRALIRILRSHSINSIWGPKAGVRYDGLYRVAGWSIRQIKQYETVGQEFRNGDFIYEIQFERDDLVPMDEVVKHPTAAEVDDYAEYKRLRRVHRELQRRGPAAKHHADIYLPANKAAPQIPTQVAPITRVRSLSRASPGAPPSATFKRPVVTVEKPYMQPAPSSQKVVSISGPIAMHDAEEMLLGPTKSTLEVPQIISRPSAQHRQSDSPHSDSYYQNHRDVSSQGSSNRTASSHLSGIREVAPWVDYDPGVVNSGPSTKLHPSFSQDAVLRNSKEGSNLRDEGRFIARSATVTSKDPPSPLSKPSKNQEQICEPTRHNVLPNRMELDVGFRKRSSRKSIFVRNRNPITKLFDGAGDYQDDYFSYEKPNSRALSLSLGATSPTIHHCMRASSSDSVLRVLTPVPLPLSPTNSFVIGRRDAVCAPYDFVLVPPISPFQKVDDLSPTHASTADPFVDEISARPIRSLPISLKKFISKPTTALPISSVVSSPVPPSMHDRKRTSEESQAALGLRKMVGKKRSMAAKIPFRDPFDKPKGCSNSERRVSDSSVAPDVLA